MSINLPDPNKTVGDPGHTSDTNLIIEGISTLESLVANIPTGPQGPQGEPGTPGTNGLAATITVVNTLTGAPASNAAVTSSGTPQNVGLTFTIPRGQTGPTGATGTQGAIGPQGEQGDPGFGLKSGGTTGQVLGKASNSDFDTEWVFPGSAPVTSVDGRQGNVTLDDLYDAAGTAAAAGSAAEAHADSLAPNYDAAGSAASAQAAAEAHADGLAPNYDSSGSAAAAQSAAEAHADGLAPNYDAAGSAAAAQAAAEAHADGLAPNYDAAGSAAAVAGDLSGHESTTTTVHGITDTANLVYTDDARLSDSRTPTAHASSHEFGGGDAIEIAATQVTGTAVVENSVRLITFVTSTTRPDPAVEGQIIYETDTNLYFGYEGANWVSIGGGAKGSSGDQIFYENDQTVTASYSIGSGKNAMSAGPITVDVAATVTVPSGSVWTVV